MATIKRPEIMHNASQVQNELNSRWCQWSKTKWMYSEEFRWIHMVPSRTRRGFKVRLI